MTPAGPVLAALRGDPGATDRLAEAWLPTVMVWANRLSGPGVDPEDVAHDAMIVAITRLPTVRDPDRFPGWLFRVVRSVVAAHRRRAWHRRWVPGLTVERADPAEGPADRAERSELARRVQRALEELPASQREALVLCDLEDRTAEAAAELVGVPVGTVKSRLRLGRERFRAAALRAGLAPALLDFHDRGDP